MKNPSASAWSAGNKVPKKIAQAIADLNRTSADITERIRRAVPLADKKAAERLIQASRKIAWAMQADMEIDGQLVSVGAMDAAAEMLRTLINDLGRLDKKVRNVIAKTPAAAWHIFRGNARPRRVARESVSVDEMLYPLLPTAKFLEAISAYETVATNGQRSLDKALTKLKERKRDSGNKPGPAIPTAMLKGVKKLYELWSRSIPAGSSNKRAFRRYVEALLVPLSPLDKRGSGLERAVDRVWPIKVTIRKRSLH